MAEMNAAGSPSHKKQRVPKLKKLSTRIDLTPMVDLGFLLITFFIYTTALSKPMGLKIMLPKDVPDNVRNQTPVSGVLTILLGEQDKLFYYERDNPEFMKLTDFPGIRKIILNKKIGTRPKDFMIIIKASPEASFQNIVNIMDEMNINEVKKYAMADIDPNEHKLMRNSLPLAE